MVARVIRVMASSLVLAALTGCQAPDSPLPRGSNRSVAANRPVGANTAKPLPLPPQSNDYISFEGGVKVYPALKRVEMPANLIGSLRRPLEFLIVGPGGASHEALFSTSARSEHIKRGLEIIGLREASVKAAGRGYLETPQGDVVRISIRFKHAETGADTVVRVEDWLWDSLLKRSPDKGQFVFTGGIEQYMPELNRSVVAADQLGNMVALWHDASCIIDNRHKHGSISDVYLPNPDAPGLPEAGAELTVIFEPEDE